MRVQKVRAGRKFRPLLNHLRCEDNLLSDHIPFHVFDHFTFFIFHYNDIGT